MSVRVMVEGYWPKTRAGNGWPVVTQRFIFAKSPLTAFDRAEAEDPETEWYFACLAKDMIPLREKRETAFMACVATSRPLSLKDYVLATDTVPEYTAIPVYRPSWKMLGNE